MSFEKKLLSKIVRVILILGLISYQSTYYTFRNDIMYINYQYNEEKAYVEGISYKKHMKANDKTLYIEKKKESYIISNSVYMRGDVNQAPRTKNNDVLPYVTDSIEPAHPREMEFKQEYVLEFYQGSKFVGSSGFPGEVNNQTDFTIISQTSKERLFYLPMLVDRWQGQFCIVIFLNTMDVNNTKDFIRQQRFPDRLHLILYLVQSNETTCVYHQAEELHCEKETVYPLNRLRNIAIQNIQTTHFIVFDMDMWPSKHLYSTLHNLPTSYLESPYVATIIPAFSLPERIMNYDGCLSLEGCVRYAATMYPETKEELVRCMNQSGCTIFRPQSLTHDYLPEDWATLSNTTLLTKINCFREYYLEPYLMVRKTPDTPQFAEQFINYGFNKVQWVEHLRYSGYEFHVLSHAYAIDMPHPESPHATKYMQKFQTMQAVYLRFLMDLRANNKDESRQIICKNNE